MRGSEAMMRARGVPSRTAAAGARDRRCGRAGSRARWAVAPYRRRMAPDARARVKQPVPVARRQIRRAQPRTPT